ncbi:MAG: sulfatase-like hydrolase/transferase [Acidobacteriia bacterium]|nr:sulfatase-like hydrolase/transferase [Terriglobia bacterium]
MRFLRAHPVIRVGLLLMALRLAGLAARYFLPSAGSIGDRAVLFLAAASFHVGTLTVIIATFLLCSLVGRAVRRPVTILACVVFVVLLIAGEADLAVAAVTGVGVTPTALRTSRGIRLLASREFLDPLLAHLGAVAAGLLASAGVVAWIARAVRRDRGPGAHDAAPSRVLLAMGAGAVLMWLPTLAPWTVAPPIEASFAREYLGLDRAVLRDPEPEAVRRLRAAVGLPTGAAWLSDRYPLVYGRSSPAAHTARPDRPDIIVVMIESLRAEEIASITGARASVTPNLDALAARSVVFPTFTSNGFPSAPSIMAFHASAWPHRRKEIVTDFTDRAFESVPGRLRGLGYETLHVGADPQFTNQAAWLPRWYPRAIELSAGGRPADDREIIGRGIEEIRRHDAASPGQPLFEFIATFSTHYPFERPADDDEPAAPPADTRARYREVLHYTDREVGRLTSFLATRPRRERTVTIVVGDHSFYVDLRKTSGVPENDNLWTAAIVNGPADLVGAPRRNAGPASHVDMAPTILAMVGDDRPSAALGSDLFGAPRTGARTAVAVRPGGLRFDREGYSVIVDARTPNHTERRVAFPGLFPPAAPIAPDVSAAQLTDWVTTWSYLIERNRVWNDQWLSWSPPAPSIGVRKSP